MSKKDFSILKTHSKPSQLTNGRSLCLILTALLILASGAPLFVVSVKAPSTGDYPEIPGGIPVNAVQ